MAVRSIPDDIGRRDLFVVERRRVAQPLLEPECPGEPIPREFRHRGREIGPESVPPSSVERPL